MVYGGTARLVGRNSPMRSDGIDPVLVIPEQLVLFYLSIAHHSRVATFMKNSEILVMQSDHVLERRYFRANWSHEYRIEKYVLKHELSNYFIER